MAMGTLRWVKTLPSSVAMVSRGTRRACATVRTHLSSTTQRWWWRTVHRLGVHQGRVVNLSGRLGQTVHGLGVHQGSSEGCIPLFHSECQPGLFIVQNTLSRGPVKGCETWPIGGFQVGRYNECSTFPWVPSARRVLCLIALSCIVRKPWQLGLGCFYK